MLETLSVTVADDELGLIQSIFGDDITVEASAVPGRLSGTRMSVLVTVTQDLPGGSRVVVPFAFNALPSGAALTVGDFGPESFVPLSAPACDERLADYTMRRAMAPIVDSVLPAFPEAADLGAASPYCLVFVEGGKAALGTSGALFALIGAVREAITDNPKLFTTHTTSSAGGPQQSSSALSTPARGGVQPPPSELNTSLAEFLHMHVTAARPAHFAVRVYKLEHMRRPTEYVKTLHSWMDGAAFNGRSGFLSSIIVAEPRTPRVLVGILHAHVVSPAASSSTTTAAQRDEMIPPSPMPSMGPALASSFSAMGTASNSFSSASPPSEAGGECPALPDISTFERMWKTVSIDVDAKGRPCQERLCRNVVDGCQWLQEVPASISKWINFTTSGGAPIQLGTVRHVVFGVGTIKPTNADALTAVAGNGEGLSRELVEAAVLDCVGECPASLVPPRPAAAATDEAAGGMTFTNALVPSASEQIRGGALWN